MCDVLICCLAVQNFFYVTIINYHVAHLKLQISIKSIEFCMEFQSDMPIEV